jgi:PilZ domain-containing protein
MGNRSEGSARAEAQVIEVEQPASDRRESRRLAVALMIRDLALGGSFEPRRGNLALGGVFFDDLHPPAGDRFEVRFLLPGGSEQIRAEAEVLEVVQEGEIFGTRLRFVDISLEHEMAIARCLQG